MCKTMSNYKSHSSKLICYLIFVGLMSATWPSFCEELSEKVSHRLEAESLGAHEIDIYTNRSRVTLSGWVSSEKDRKTIVDSVAEVAGVDEVVDELQVDDKNNPRIILDDNKLGEARIAEVNAAVENYLSSSKLKGSYQLDYELTEQGILIKGELPAGAETQALLYHVKRIVSTPVYAQISVRPWPGDKELEQRVRTQLAVKQGIDLRGILIEARNGIVTLSGHRKNHKQADQIASAVLMVEGVRDIKSNLTFEGSRNDP